MIMWREIGKDVFDDQSYCHGLLIDVHLSIQYSSLEEIGNRIFRQCMNVRIVSATTLENEKEILSWLHNIMFFCSSKDRLIKMT